MQKNCIDFRLQNSATSFAQEVYFKYSSEIKALHPKNFSSTNHIQLNSLPEVGEWGSIFQMFPFENLIEYATYFNHLFPHLTKDELETLISGYGLQATMAKQKELLRLAKLSSPLKRLFVEKNVPSRLLFLLESLEYDTVEKLVDHLSVTYLKNNVVKKIVEFFSDLTPKLQKMYLEKISESKQKTSENGLTLLNEQFREILYSLRFPARDKVNNQMHQLLKPIRSQAKNIKIHYDETFEKNSLSLEINIESNAELLKLPSFMQSEELLKSLAQALALVKNPRYK